MAQTDKQTVFERRTLLSIIGIVKVNNLRFTTRPIYSEINQKQSTKVDRSKDKEIFIDGVKGNRG